MNAPLRIHSGQFEAYIAPALGGAVLGFREWRSNGWINWLRPAPLDCSDVSQTACFPLLPFSNRIDQGRFRWRESNIELPANFPPEPHAIHGQGWQSEWSVSEQATDRVLMMMHHEKDNWPWEYEARQEILIDGEALIIILSIENGSREPMPAGIGFHPFFPRTEKTTLKADVKAIHLNGEDGLPVKAQARHQALTALRAGDRLVDGLDNVFEGWGSSATICWHDRGRSLQLTADSHLNYLVIYTPERKDCFCVEPVSHVNGAFGCVSAHRACRAGVVELKQGEEVRSRVTFRPGHSS